MKNFIVLPRVKDLVCVCLSLVAGMQQAHAGEFERVYSAALEYDARFQGAKHALRYTEEGVPLARASLLPSVSVNLSDTAVRGTREISGAGSTDLDYRTPTQSINVRAPLALELQTNWAKSSSSHL